MARILIVEDEPMISMMLADWLAEMGHQTVGPVGSVERALALVDSATFEAGILDLNLGRQNAYPIAEILTSRGVPFAFATGDCAHEIDPRFSNKINLPKPYDFEAVQRVIDLLVN